MLKLGLLSGVACAALIVGGGYGSSALAEAKPRPAEGTSLGEVVVTARHRSENIQTTPVAVSAIVGSQLEKQVAFKIDDLQRLVPDLQVTGGTGLYGDTSAGLFIRGIGASDIESTTEPGVGLFIDGVYQPTTSGALINVFDPAQVEVLRGPQGTLFGKNTIGGVISYVSRRPDGRWGARGDVTVGNFGRNDYRMTVDFPIIKGVVDGSVAALWKNSSGYVKNLVPNVSGPPYTSENELALRAQLRFRPTATIDYTLIGDYYRAADGSGATYNATPAGWLLSDVLGLYGYSPATNPDHPKPDVIQTEMPSKMNQTIWGVTGNGTWDLGAATVTSITGYRKTDEDYNIEVDSSPILFFEVQNRTQDRYQFSQELRLTSKAGRGLTFNDRLDWTVGAFYFNSKYTQVQPSVGLPNEVSDTGQTTTSYAVYGQGDIHLTDRLRLTLGARYTEDEKEFTTDFNHTIGTTAPFVSAHHTWNNVSSLVNLDYRFSDDVFAYVKYAQGYRAGGYQGRATDLQSMGPYGEEKLTSYEGGLKLEFWDKRARINLAAFYEDYRGVQVSVVLPNCPDPSNPSACIGTDSVTRNAANETIWGVEAEFTVRPARGLTFTGSLSLLNPRWDSFFADVIGTGTPQDNTGFTPPAISKVTAQLGAEYVRDVPVLNGDLRAAVNWSYRSSEFGDVPNTPFNEVKAFSIIDAQLGWQKTGGAYGVTAYVKNLLDERVFYGGVVATGLFRQGSYNKPREYGVRLSFDF